MRRALMNAYGLALKYREKALRPSPVRRRTAHLVPGRGRARTSSSGGGALYTFCAAVYTGIRVNTEMHSGFVISQTDPRPLYLQIKEQIRHRVAVGELKAGDEIPSIRALAADTRVSVITVKRAYLELELEGVIQTRQGRGSFVAEGVDLGERLKEQELDQHLEAAVRVAALLRLDDEQLAERLRKVSREVAERKPK